jgi:hypothetical protein
MKYELEKIYALGMENNKPMIYVFNNVVGLSFPMDFV